MTKRSDQTLRGKLVYLRRLRLSDELEFTTLARRSRRFHTGVMSLPTTHDSYVGYLERTRMPSTETFAICRLPDAAIVGTVSLSQIFFGPLRSAYLGYGLGFGFTGNGYAREAVQLMITFALKQLKLHRIEANIQPQNLRSKHLVESLGFSLEGYSPRYLKIGGRWRDHERWAIIKNNWKQSR